MLNRRVSLIFTAALMFGAGQVLAQDHAAHAAQEKLMKGSAVAIEGCVTQGENDDTFVLGAVREIPGRPVETGLRRLYWLDDVDELRGKAGQLVRVEGRIDGIEEGKVDVKPGKAEDGGTIVELEGPGRDIDTTAAVVGTAGVSANAPKPALTIIRLDVDKVTPLRACGA